MSSPQVVPSGDEELGEFDAANIADDEAFSAFYDRWSAAVYGLAYHIFCDQAQAEAVAEEAFCRAWPFTRGQEDDARSSGLRLLRLTQSLAISALRRVREQYPESSLIAPLAEATAPTSQRALLSTPRPARQSAVEMAFWDGLTCREIAAATGATVAQALNDLHAGFRGLNGSMAFGARCLDSDSSSPTSR